MLVQEIQRFIDERVAALQKMTTESSQAYWDFTTTGSPELQTQLAEMREEMARFLSSREDFAKICEYRAVGVADPLLARELEALYRAYLANQLDSETIQKMVQLEMTLSNEFTNFRAQLNGKRLSNNEILDVLQTSTDSAERKAVWLSSKQIGQQVAPTLLELVKVRNAAYQKLGFSDYYSGTLAMNELDETEMFEILDRLKELTDEPFRKAKAEMDAQIARKLGLTPTELMPWHYSDPFFQETPASDEVDLNQFFTKQDPVALSKTYYDGIGLDAEGILQRSDLFEREGKDQHAYCIHIDKEGDVRVLCNMRNTEYWMNTILHELGHGVYDQYIDMNLPYLLREPAHSFTTEAIAMMFGRLSRDPEWLKAIAGADATVVDSLREKLHRQEQLALLVFIRWGLVMVYFERQLYKNPDQDLNTLWWDLVEELQFLQRPEGPLNPDWAAKVHFGTFPVYYHNYILGYLAAYQIDAAVKKACQISDLVNHPAIGTFLIENVFRPGARYHWNEMLERATGYKLTPEFAVAIFQ